MKTTSSLFLLVLVAMLVAACGGQESEPVQPPVKKAAGLTGPGDAERRPADAGYGLERTRPLPADVARQISYMEGGGPGCVASGEEPEGGFFGTADNLDAESARSPLGDQLEYCVAGFDRSKPITVTLTGPTGRVTRTVAPGRAKPRWIEFTGMAGQVTLALEHRRRTEIGLHQIEIRQGARIVRALYRVLPGPPTVRLLGRAHVAGQPLRIIGSGFRPGARTRLALYECTEYTRAKLRTVIPVRAERDGSFAYELRTRRHDHGCFLVREGSIPGVRDDWFENTLRLQGGVPKPSEVLLAERRGCRPPVTEVRGTACFDAERLAEGFIKNLADGEPCADCVTFGAYGLEFSCEGPHDGAVTCHGKPADYTVRARPATVTFEAGRGNATLED